MKLAEALIKRADLKTHIAQITSRMTENVLVQEGDEPDEDVAELQILYESAMTDLEQIIIRINKTNNETVLDADCSLASAIAKRDCIKSKITDSRCYYASNNSIQLSFDHKWSANKFFIRTN